MADEKIEKLRNRVYQIWQSKGRPVGRDLEDWLEAEGELEEADDRNHRAIKEEAGLEAARAYHRDAQEFGRFSPDGWWLRARNVFSIISDQPGVRRRSG